jgi:hypothetical protein
MKWFVMSDPVSTPFCLSWQWGCGCSQGLSVVVFVTSARSSVVGVARRSQSQHMARRRDEQTFGSLFYSCFENGVFAFSIGVRCFFCITRKRTQHVWVVARIFLGSGIDAKAMSQSLDLGGDALIAAEGGAGAKDY